LEGLTETKGKNVIISERLLINRKVVEATHHEKKKAIIE